MFAEHLVRPGDLSVELGRWLAHGRRAREIGDHDDFLGLESDEATEAVSRAERFLERSRQWLAACGFDRG